MTRLADSILVCVRTGDDASRERWFNTLQARSTNTFVALSNSPISVSMSCLAPNKTVATNLARELSDYFSTASEMHLIAPWAPEARGAGFPPRRRAREQWTAIGRETEEVWSDSALRSYPDRISGAMRRGATAEMDRLQKEQLEKNEELQNQARERLRLDLTTGIDPALVDLHAKLNHPGLTNRTERKALLREVAGRLGEVPYVGDRPTPGADRYGVASGFASRHGLLLRLPMLSFYDIRESLPAMAEWLTGLGCRQIKYDLQGPSWLDSLDELEENAE